VELVVGRIAKAHGIGGEVVVDVRTDDPDSRFAPGAQLRLKRGRGVGEIPAVIESVRPHSGRLLVRLRGVNDRDAAEALRGHLFVVDSADLPSLEDPDEFYDHELEGLCIPRVANCSRCVPNRTPSYWCPLSARS